MKKVILILFSLNIYGFCFCQSKKINEIGLSPNMVYNKTTVYDIYSGARATNKTGTAFSYGINLNYSKSIYKSIFLKFGAGFFNQKFGIARGFDYIETGMVTRLFYSTLYYTYKSYNYLVGIGYNHTLQKTSKLFPLNSNIRVVLNYNNFKTFEQEFKHYGNSVGGNINPQIRNENYKIGESIILQVGIIRPIFKRFKLGLDLLFPVYNKWSKDLIFRDNPNEFYGSKFSIGGSFNFIYNLKKHKL